MSCSSSRCRPLLLAFVLAVLASHSAGAQGLTHAPTRTLRVVGTDYAFTAPDTVSAGMTAFQFSNRGAHGHELVVALVRLGTNAAQIVAASQAGLPAPRLAEAYADGPPLGALFVAAGATGRANLVTALVRGRTYVLVCTLHDVPTAPQHAALGMFHVLQVR